MEEQHRDDSLEGRLADAFRRSERRQALARELLAGRLTLREAAARSRALAEADPDFRWYVFRQTYAGASDAERHCRHMIAAVAEALRDRPAEAAEVVARLEAELQEHRKRDGTIRLPEPQR